MHWNIRVVETVSMGDTMRTFAEVYYDSEGRPTGYGEPFLCWEPDEGESGDEIPQRMTKALAQPVLRYPQDFSMPKTKPMRGPRKRPA